MKKMSETASFVTLHIDVSVLVWFWLILLSFFAFCWCTDFTCVLCFQVFQWFILLHTPSHLFGIHPTMTYLLWTLIASTTSLAFWEYSWWIFLFESWFFKKEPLLVKVWMGLPAVSPKIIVYLGLNLQSYVFANTNNLTGHIVTLWSTFFFRPYHRHIHRERCYALCEVLTWWWKCWTFCSLLVWQVLPHVEGCFYSDRQNLMPGSWCWFERLLHVLFSEILLKI